MLYVLRRADFSGFITSFYFECLKLLDTLANKCDINFVNNNNIAFKSKVKSLLPL